MAQSGPGKIRLFEHFAGPEWIIAETAASGKIGQFRVVGQGVGDADAGITILETDAHNGVGQMVSPNATDNDAIAITTAIMFDVVLMGPMFIEARVRIPDLDTKEVFIGFSDLNSDTHSLEGVTIHGATEAITLTASDLIGFFLSSELTEDEMWHSVYNGGTRTGEILSTNIELVDAVAGEFQILRLEIDPNGTARWYIDGKLLKTVTGAVSTTTDLCAQVVLEIKGTGSNELLDLDYLQVEANMDWTV